MTRTALLALWATVLLISTRALGNEDAGSNETCPESPVGSLVWKATRGPDFWVCYGTPPGATHPVIGVYYGWAADFHLAEPASREIGSIEGMPIEWQVSITDSGQLKRDAIFLVKTRPDPSAMQVHVWIIADDKAELDRAKQIVRRTSF